MALVKVNIEDFKKRGRGILDRLADKITDKVNDKIENAVEDVFGKALKKIGLSDRLANQISSRFGDSLTRGLEDDYFRTFSSEINRVGGQANQQIKSNFVSARESAETTIDSISRASGNQKIDGLPTLQYPSHLGKYYITLKFKQYQRPAPEVRGTLPFKQAIVLPISREIRESFDIKAGAEQTGTAGNIADAAAKLLEQGNLDGAGQAALAIGYAKLVQDVAGDAGPQLAQFTGAAANPNLQAIFSGVDLRQHRFDWLFAPRNAQESEELKKILKALKAYSLPAYSSIGTAALSYPFLCQPSIVPLTKTTTVKEGGKDIVVDDGSLIQFPPCLISNVEINYSPQGLPAFFQETNQPTLIQLSITMLETELQTADRYGREGGDRLRDTLDTFNDIGKETFGVDVVGGVTATEQFFNEKLGLSSNQEE
jgi:hypothetical protein